MFSPAEKYYEHCQVINSSQVTYTTSLGGGGGGGELVNCELLFMLTILKNILKKYYEHCQVIN